MRVGVEALLPVDVETAWRTLVEWERQPAWMRDAVDVRLVGRRARGIGTRIAVRTAVLGVPAFTDVLEVTAWSPPTRLAMAHRRFVRGVGEWRLEAHGDGTAFAWVEDVTLPVPMLGALALAVYRPFLRAVMRRSLRGLQHVLSEGRGSTGLPRPRTIA